MTSMPTGVATAKEQATPEAPGALRFHRLWLFSPRADLAILGIPLALTLVAAGASAVLAPGAADGAHRLLGWTAQNLLGNATHVVLTFLLFGVHRDVLTAAPNQPRTVLAGAVAMLAVGAALFFTFYVDRSIHTFAVAVIFNVFGMHHTLSQHRGLWSLHGLRGSQEGLPAPSPLERKLQQLYVPLLLSILLTRIFFVAESAAPDAPAYLDVGQGAVLPWQTLPLLIALWLGYFLLLFRAVLRSGTASGPKVLYLLGMATATGLALVAPSWGYVMLPGMHGLEYYVLSARMLEPREGDAPRLRQKLIWPAMVASMLPLFALGVVHGFLLDGPMKGPLGIGGGTQAHPLLRGLTCLGFATVLAHYFADAFIFRFRIPSIRQVMLRRLGFSPMPRPASGTR
ncbi:hypothetical protein [Corallococcus sp. Z5C101001]|uniref:hypothetical protein n=1 Tax=Corallococcus sp. Z5C101001 TaxID=2596829 RepID=UPI00118037B3|nr:hypothetical protein [Corallococcus sp. Z5C101001]TSC20336.1 hypothetical protein FOF48_35540 [Corallococcus sp. Z5C101001]